jgi:hypothetical protein
LTFNSYFLPVFPAYILELTFDSATGRYFIFNASSTRYTPAGSPKKDENQLIY